MDHTVFITSAPATTGAQQCQCIKMSNQPPYGTTQFHFAFLFLIRPLTALISPSWFLRCGVFDIVGFSLPAEDKGRFQFLNLGGFFLPVRYGEVACDATKAEMQ